MTYLANILVSAALAALVLYIHSAYQSYRRLSHIPGPFYAGFSRYYMLKWMLSGRNHLYFNEANLKYGPLARIGPNHLMCNDPNVIRRMHEPRSPYMRGEWYDTVRFKPGVDNVFSMRDETRHAELRRKMAAGYSGKENPGLEESVDERVQDLVSLIERKYISEGGVLKEVDLCRLIQYFTVDIISGAAFDAPFGNLKDDEDKYKYISTTEALMPSLVTMGVFPEVFRFSERSSVMSMMAPSTKDNLGFGRVMHVSSQKVAERFGPNAKVKQDMLGSFIKHGLTQEEADSEAVLQLSAGFSTTASAITSIFLHILTSPNIFNKLRKEVDTMEAMHELSSPVTDDEARSMQYLQACIKEGLRVDPLSQALKIRLCQLRVIMSAVMLCQLELT